MKVSRSLIGMHQGRVVLRAHVLSAWVWLAQAFSGCLGHADASLYEHQVLVTQHRVHRIRLRALQAGHRFVMRFIPIVE